LQIKFFFLSISHTHLFRQIERYSKSKIDQVPKTPSVGDLFSNAMS
jgi:hypothetical protein